MADIVSTRRVDDFDHTVDAPVRIEFSIDGKYFRLDLSQANADRFHEAIEPFKKVATPTERKITNLEIRNWAQAQNISVTSTGYVSKSVQRKYYEAHNLPFPTE